MDEERNDELENTELPKEHNEKAESPRAKKGSLSRRSFLGTVSGAAAVGTASGLIGLEPFSGEPASARFGAFLY
jgi:hypothetical protein